MEITTIQIEKKTLDSLKGIKQYPKQSYNEVLKNLVSIYMILKRNDQYDKFLHEIQKPKMKELWENKDDEIWNSA